MAIAKLHPIIPLREQIRAWLGEIEARVPALGEKAKYIRDPLHGSVVLSPHEVRILDTYVMQRLRGIHQLGLAYLTFPTAGHSRFEHSLGVRFIAERMLNRLEEVRGGYTTQQRATVLAAALLHDVGHGIFSHTIETIISAYPFFSEQFDAGAGPLHEQIGAVLITEDPIATCLRDMNVDPLAVAALMEHDTVTLTRLQIPPELWGVISGPLDADKLDYFARDAYFSGVVSAIDPERIFQSLTIGPQSQLAITLAGASALDQMLYHQVQIYADLYGHQKILAAEVMLGALVETMLKRNPNGRYSQIFVRGQDGRSLPIGMDRIATCLRMSDEAFLAAPTDSSVVASLQDRLLRRELLHTAYTLSFNEVQDGSEAQYLQQLPHLRAPETLARLRLALHHQHPDIPLVDIGVAAVRWPKLEGVDTCVIGRDQQPARNGTLFEGWHAQDSAGLPAHMMLRHYQLYRARIMIFCPPAAVARVRPTARMLLQEALGPGNGRLVD